MNDFYVYTIVRVEEDALFTTQQVQVSSKDEYFIKEKGNGARDTILVLDVVMFRLTTHIHIHTHTHAHKILSVVWQSVIR